MRYYKVITFRILGSLFQAYGLDRTSQMDWGRISYINDRLNKLIEEINHETHRTEQTD